MLKILPLIICVFFIAPSAAIARWKSDNDYKGQVKMVETRFPSQGGRVVMISRTFFDQEGQVLKTQDWTEIEGVQRGNRSIFITRIRQGETLWTESRAEGATSSNGASFSRPLGSQGRVEGGASYHENGTFSQLHLRYFDRCGEVIHDISYLSYEPFVLQKDVSNIYVTNCQLSETDAMYDKRSREVTRYDSKGRPMDIARYSTSGTLIERETIQYNNHDDEIARTIVASDGTVKTKHLFELEYDAMGNWIKRTSKVLVEDGESVEGQVGFNFRSFEYFEPSQPSAQ